MSVLKKPFGLVLVAGVLISAAFFSSHALAKTHGVSYFEGVSSELTEDIPAGYDGSYSTERFVMPDWSPKDTPDGGGAIGTDALGISQDENDSAVIKQAMYNFLRSKNQSGSDWEKMGSAFIVYRMLGKDWGVGSRVVSAADWDDLKQRLDNPNIQVQRSKYDWSINSAGVFANGKFDAIRSDPSIEHGANIVDAWQLVEGGRVVFAIQVICANPLGGLEGIPKPELSTCDSLLVEKIDRINYKFTANATAKGGATIVGYDYDFGDGHTQNDAGKTVSHTYEDSSGSTYTVRVSVKVKAGGATKTITGPNCRAVIAIDDAPPEPVYTCDSLTALKTDRTIRFTAYATAINGATIVNYVFDFGNGSQQTTSSNTTTQTYANAGTYTARVTVTVNVNGETKTVTSAKCQVTITIEKQYSLTPKAETNKLIIQPDDTVTVRNYVTSVGLDRSNPTDWLLTALIYQPGAAINKTGGDSSSDACRTFSSAGRQDCKEVARKVPQQEFEPNRTTDFTPIYSYVAPIDMIPGTKVCFTASVSRPTQNSTPVWRHSNLACVTIAKRPKVQVWGGDVRAGGSINTSTNTFASLGLTFGSWGEYGALSGSSNSGFASGSGLNQGNANSSQAQWSKLTFANNGRGGCSFGCFSFAASPPSFASQFKSSPASSVGGSISLSGLNSGTYTANSLTITGSTIGPGKSIIIIATGTVTIAGDITYSDGPYAQIGDIPQVVIRAGAVNITNAVRIIDAWIIATGKLNTCSDVAETASLSTAICNNTLRINGPVIADKVYLRRTAGSGSAPGTYGEPAETFNLRADAYLWGSTYGAETARARTFYTRELPPRF